MLAPDVYQVDQLVHALEPYGLPASVAAARFVILIATMCPELKSHAGASSVLPGISARLLTCLAFAAGVAPGVISPAAIASATLPPPASTALALAGKVVGIDPGHNGRNYSDPSYIDHLVWNGRELEACDTTGTETDGGYTEARFNFDVAARALAQAIVEYLS